jgi:hypothetical protein
MIDEKRLIEWNAVLFEPEDREDVIAGELHHVGQEVPGVSYVRVRLVDDDLFRLARLGLWAEKHGIPAMKECVSEAGGDCDKPSCQVLKPHHHGQGFVYFPWEQKREHLAEALAALPKPS